MSLYLGERGDKDLGARLVLVDYLHHVGHDGGLNLAVLDHSVDDHRLALVVRELQHRHGTRLAFAERVASEIVNALHRKLGVPTHEVEHHAAVSVCDRNLIIAAMHSLSKADFETFAVRATDAFARLSHLSDEYKALAAKSAAIADRVVAVIGDLVTISAVSTTQEFCITQGTKPGATLQKGTYRKGVEGAEDLVVSECAITDAGVRINKLDSGTDVHDQVLSITNKLKRKYVVLTAGDTVQRVRPKGTLIVFASEMTEDFDLSIEPVPPPMPPPPMTPPDPVDPVDPEETT